MTNPTTPFGWQMPTSTDLVTDLPADFETFGQAVATSMADLLGGTTGQVLSKASNTNMDFTWVTTDDANAIQNSIVDAKGDIVAASANDTPARLAVGANGETLVADSSTSTGLRYQGNFAAGKNKIINGDMNIWQRGTSFSSPADASYLTDRFFVGKNGNATYTVSRQAATYGAITGYEPNYYCRFAVSSIGTTTAMELHQRIEDVTTLAGQTVTVSFYAKADASRALTLTVLQYFGSGGSSLVTVANAASLGNATTSFQRFTYTFSMPQTTGKTITAGNFIDISLNMPASAFTIDFWGLQVEASNTATSFNTATGTIQGELAACQRYYFRLSGTNVIPYTAYARDTTGAFISVPFPSVMRIAPTAVDYSALELNLPGTANYSISAVALNGPADNATTLTLTASGLTQWRPYLFKTSGVGYLGFSAEL